MNVSRVFLLCQLRECLSTDNLKTVAMWNKQDGNERHFLAAQVNRTPWATNCVLLGNSVHDHNEMVEEVLLGHIAYHFYLTESIIGFKSSHSE